MQIALRPALPQDRDYCRRIYFAEMKTIIEELNLDRATQAANFEQQWQATQVQIITLDGCDVGWLQSFMEDDALFIAQVFIDSPFQRRGIGTEVMERMIREATRLRRMIRLDVVKINPAVRLYERLGFRIMRQDDGKFYMQRDIDNPASS